MKKVIKKLVDWLDVVFLICGFAFTVAGVMQINIPAGYIVLGVCFLALAFFVGKNQAQRR